MMVACRCRYQSVGESKCCPDLVGKELGRYEHSVIYDSDNDNESDYTDGDCDDDNSDKEMTDASRRKKWVYMKRRTIVQFCESDCFKVSIMTAIFLNTVTMAMEHYRQVSNIDVDGISKKRIPVSTPFL